MAASVQQGLLARWHARTLDRHGLLGSPGYWLPDPESMQWHVLRGRIDGAVAAEAGGDGSFLLLHPAHAMTRALQVRIAPRVSGCTLVIGPDCSFHGELEFHASGATAILCGGRPASGHWGWMKAVIWSAGVFYLGRGTSSNGTHVLVSGPDTSVLLGDDCMLASRTAIRSDDQHAVVQLDTGAWCNPPGDVILEPHVWLGEGAMVGKNVVIGLGSIVGAQALVLRSCARFSLLGGVPARVLRSGLTWDRAPRPGPDLPARMRALADAVRPV